MIRQMLFILMNDCPHPSIYKVGDQYYCGQCHMPIQG